MRTSHVISGALVWGLMACSQAEPAADEEAVTQIQAELPASEPIDRAPTETATPSPAADEAVRGGAGGFAGGLAEAEIAEQAPAATGMYAAGGPGRAARPNRGRPIGMRSARPTVPPRERQQLPQALPQNGVLASSFVGGSGVRARLDDLLDRGVMVDGQMVRLEAFQDRDRLPYAVPRNEGMAMYAELERARLASDRERVHLQIALLGRQGEAPARPRMDVRLVLDRSGSMRGEKWTQAIAAAHGLVNELQAGDTFGLISYSDDASLDHAPARVGNRRAAHAAIDRLVPGGGTNIGSALEMAEANTPRARSGQTVGLVVLVSDGRVTVGQTNPGMLGDMARRMFDRSGVLTTSIGLGTDFDEQTMLTIAREGSGSYHFVRRAADIGDILEDELEARVQAVAQGLRVRIELGDGIVAQRVYGSRLLSEREHAAVRATEVAVDQRIARELGVARTRQREEESGLRIHLPTFKRGDQHVILMELDVPAGTDTTQIARVTLDYKDLVRRRNGSIVREVEAARVSDRSVAQASVARVVKRTVLAFQAGEALQGAANALQRGDDASATRLIAERRELLEAGAELWRDPSLGRDAALLARYERVLRGTGGWDYQTRNELVMAMNYFGDQRMR